MNGTQATNLFWKADNITKNLSILEQTIQQRYPDYKNTMTMDDFRQIAYTLLEDISVASLSLSEINAYVIQKCMSYIVSDLEQRKTYEYLYLTPKGNFIKSRPLYQSTEQNLETTYQTRTIFKNKIIVNDTYQPRRNLTFFSHKCHGTLY